MTTPNQPPPDDALSGEDLSALDGLNEASWRAGLNDRVIGTENSGSGFNGAAGFLGAIGNMIQGVLSGGFLGAILNPFATLVGMRWDQVDAIDGQIPGITQSIVSLEDANQALQDVIGFGQATMTTSAPSNMTGVEVPVVFDAPIGPQIGCTHDPVDGTYTLGSRGLWWIDASLGFSNSTVGTGVIQLWIKVWTPDGQTLHKQRVAFMNTALVVSDPNNAASLYARLPVVVPTAGYIVRVSAFAGGGRQIIAGDTTATLTVDKKSSETE